MARPFLVAGCVVVALVVADTAAAHSDLAVSTGFYGGLLHPLFVPAHLLVVAALGLLIGQQAPRWGRAMPFIYVVAIVAGLAAVALAYVPSLTEESLLALTAVAGLLVALARPMPSAIGWLLAAGIGLALALDSPPDEISLSEASVALLGTACGATILLLAVVEGASRLTRDWQRIGMRILGSWIAASALLVLAMRLAK